MGAVPVDLAAARAAVEVTAQRAADLVRSLPDPSLRVPGLDWTVGQTAAHLVAAARYYPRYATGQVAPDATIDLADGNLERIAQVAERGLGELADLLIAETQQLLVLTADLEPDHRVAFHGGTTLDLAEQTGILLGEFVIHGLDLARSVPRPWPINPGHARLVIAAATALLPRYIDPDAARGVTVAYDIRIRGGPRFGLQLTNGAATVLSGPAGSVDCHISADPVAFLYRGLWSRVAVAADHSGQADKLGPQALASVWVDAPSGESVTESARGEGDELAPLPVDVRAGAGHQYLSTGGGGFCWPLRCGPGADQGDHDHGRLRSRAVRGRLRRSVLRDRGRERSGRACRAGRWSALAAAGPGLRKVWLR